MARVLVVEDEAVLRLTFSQFLEDEGYTVVNVDSYNGAIEVLERESVDIIVTDIVLGGKTGIDLLRTVHEQDMNCSIIMITGEPNVETAAEAVRHGAFDYLAKPVTGQQLQRVVRIALDRRELARERDSYAARMDLYRRELEAIFNSVNEGVMTVDQDLKVRRVNNKALAMLGHDPEWMIAQSLDNVFSGEWMPARDALRRSVNDQVIETEFRLEINDAPGGPRVYQASTLPLVEENGPHMGGVIVLRDVTRISLLEREVDEEHIFRGMVGKSPSMKDIFKLIEDVSDTDTTVLICGESGTGKELVAAALHKGSVRAGGPFIKVNCSALAEDILESELFGHVQGAFTGAVRDRVGRFEAANGGTILLDEIGDISSRLQQRLLRVLQEREFERVGDSTPIKVDVRIIASTNRNLTAKIRSGEFREDLYYRLNVVRIELPPLRDRREDLPLLVEHLFRRFNTAFKKEIMGLAPDAMDIIASYPWNGNIRELENCIERSFVVCHDSVIRPEHLPPEVTHQRQPFISMQNSGASGSKDKAVIIDVLGKTDWNIAKSARMLGMARNTLYQRMKSMGINRDDI